MGDACSRLWIDPNHTRPLDSLPEMQVEIRLGRQVQFLRPSQARRDVSGKRALLKVRSDESHYLRDLGPHYGRG